MKKFISFCIIFLFIFQVALAANIITVSGTIVNLSTQEKWLAIKISEPLVTRIIKQLRSLINPNSIKSNEYRINILDNTIIENLDEEIITIDKISIGEKIIVTGELISEIKDKDPGLIQAENIKILKRKSILIVVKDFFSFSDKSGPQRLSTGNDDGAIVTGVGKEFGFGDQSIANPYNEVTFKRDNCASEGEPILISTFLAPSKPQECCKDENDQEYLQICPIPNTEVQSVTVNGLPYIVKGYCQKTCPKIKTENPFSPLKLPLIPMPTITTTRPKTAIGDVGFLDGCITDNDCFYDGEKCVLLAVGGYQSRNYEWEWFLRNDPKGCVCNKTTHKCVIVEDKNAPKLDNCDANIACSEDNTPVCGKDGKTYQNPCEAIRCYTSVQCFGACPCKTTTTTIGFIPSLRPGFCNLVSECELCGLECFEKTMLMQLKNTGKICDSSQSENWECKCQDNNCIPSFKQPVDENQDCPDTISLVCGTDGQTYKNSCEAEKLNVNVVCNKACPCDIDNNLVNCPNISEPVCGIDGKTYSNICFANNAGVEVKCNKACPCTVSSPTPSIVPSSDNMSKNVNIKGFCGIQTEAPCGNDSNCRVSGCNGNVCQGKLQPTVSTTCEYKDCYQKPLNVHCGCDQGKCQWYSTISSESSSNLLNPSINIDPVITPEASLPSASGPKVCLMALMCLDGKIHYQDCGEIGEKCYDFIETGNGNCTCRTY